MIIHFMLEASKNMGIAGEEDKLIVCLVLTMITEYISIVGSMGEQPSQSKNSGKINLGKMITYVFTIMNDKNVANCVSHSLNHPNR